MEAKRLKLVLYALLLGLLLAATLGLSFYFQHSESKKPASAISVRL